MLPAWLVALPAILLACDAPTREGWSTEPPLPPTLDEIEPAIAARLRRAADAIRADPAPAAAWGELGKELEVVGLRTHAIESYTQAQLRDPEEPRWHYRSGVCRGRMEDVAGAIDDMTRVQELAPDYAPACYRKGTFALELGELELARASFEEAARVAPDFMGGWVGLAKVHLQLDENEAAIALLEEQRDRDPGDRIVLTLLINAYRQAGRSAELPAVVAGDRGAADPELEDEDDPDELVGRFWDDPWQTELRSYRRAPEEQRLVRMLERGRTESVIQRLERKRHNEPEETSFLALLADAYARAGRNQEALDTFHALIRAEPESIAARMALVGFHEDTGTEQLALPVLEQVNAIDPDFGPAWVVRGLLLFEAKRYEECSRVLARALELDQRNDALWHRLGEARLIGKDWEGAASAFEAYLASAGSDPLARVLLARARAKLGELEAAEAELERARSLDSSPALEAKIGEVERLIQRTRNRRDRGGDEES